MKLFIRLRVHHLLVLLCLLTGLQSFAQDIHFSEFYMSYLTLNPAAAGAFKDMDATTNYRSQWGSVTANPYKTMAIAGDMRIRKKMRNTILAVGLNIFQDQAGDGNLSTLQANFSLAAHIHLDRHSILSAGLNGGVGQKSLNTSSLTWDNQYVNGAYNAAAPSLESVHSSSFFFPDFGAGVMYQYNKSEMYISGNDKMHIDIGASVTHLTQPNLSFESHASDLMFMRFAVIGNSLIGLKNTPLSLMPGFVFYRQGPVQEIQAGSMLKYNLKENSKYTGYIRSASVAWGAYYRWDDALVATFLLELANYAIGFSYDANLSKLTPASYARGGFEVSLKYVNASNYLYKNKSGF